jgi:hypothetical protein
MKIADLRDVFLAEGEHLFWTRMATDRVEGAAQTPLEAEKHYATIRLGEMYLGKSRVLWRKFSPLVHVFAAFGTARDEHHGVAGPGQLAQIGEVASDRLIVFNTRLIGPVPYRGGDLSLIAGLYSVPQEDAAAGLVATVGALAGVAGAGSVPVGELIQVVKAGVDSVLGLTKTKLRLGVIGDFAAGDPPTGGFHVGIAAAENAVPRDELWIRDGRLVQGAAPPVAQGYTGHDYLVLQIEATERREDWPGLPGLADQNETFAGVMGDTTATVTAKRDRLNALWPAFAQALRSSQYLTRHDAEAIENDVFSDLQARLNAMESGRRFETKALGPAQEEDPARFDFALVAEYETAARLADGARF